MSFYPPDPNKKDRRAEPRFALDAVVKVRTVGQGSTPAAEGSVIEVSAHGMSVWLEAPVAQGETLVLEIADDIIVAEVKDCRTEDARHRVSLLIHDSTTRSELHHFMNIT